MAGDNSKADLELAIAARRKQRGGGQPTQRELAALRRVEKSKEAEDRERYYRSVPKGDYTRLAGDRQPKVLNGQARRWGVPCGERAVDLYAVLAWFHDLLATHGPKLLGDAGDPLLAGASQSLKDEYTREQIREKREKARLAQLDVQEREQSLLSREDVHILLGKLGEALCNGGQTMQRQFGEGPHKLLLEILDDVERTTGQFFQQHPVQATEHVSDNPQPQPKPKRKPAKRTRKPGP